MYLTRISAVLWFLFIIVFYLFFDSYFSLFLLVTSIAIFLFLAVSTRIYKNKVEFSLVASEIINKGETSECFIEAKNRSYLPIVKVKCDLKIINKLTNEINKQEIYFTLNGKATEQIQIEIKSLFCGHLEISIEKVTCFDLLGLFYTTYATKSSTELLVLPNMFEMNIDLLMNKGISDHNFSHSSHLIGMNSSEIFGIKPYVPGDNVKNIHWKLSSKFDELIMKDLSDFEEHSILVLFDTSLSNDHPAIYDAMIEALSSVCSALLLKGQPYSIGWINDEINGLQIEAVSEGEYLSNIIKLIMKYGKNHQDQSTIEQNFNSMNAQYRFTQIIYITSSQEDVVVLDHTQVITLRCVTQMDEQTIVNGDGVVFTPESIKGDLRQLVI